MSKRSKEYKLINKKHQKELINIAKTTRPWDYCWGLDFLIEHIRYMYDYYKLGENVWGEDLTDKRINTLKEAIDEYDAWKNCESKYFIHHETGGKENGQGIKFGTVEKPGGPIKEEISDWWIENACGTYKETVKAFNKEYKEHRNKFFKIVANNIEIWWD